MVLLNDTHAGGKRWGLVLYGINYNILAYYRLGSKDHTSYSILDELNNFIAEHGIPRMLITDSNGVLVARKKRKHFLGQIFTPLHLSEPDKQNQNPVKSAIQNLKAGCSKIRNSCGAGFLS